MPHSPHTPQPLPIRLVFIAVLILLLGWTLSGCGTRLPPLIVDEPPPPKPIPSSCLKTHADKLSEIDSEAWEGMDIVERARAILRMRTNDAGRYHELLKDYRDCVEAR